MDYNLLNKAKQGSIVFNMSHRSEAIRNQIIASGSPLRNHSLNGGWMNREAHGIRRLHLNKKLLRSIRTGNRDSGRFSWEERNLMLIISDVHKTLETEDYQNPTGFRNKIRYLSENGIFVRGLNYDNLFPESLLQKEEIA